MSLLVSEIFHSFQGEGPSTGRPAVFLRLGGCNLYCSWCDTPYTWDWQGRNGVTYKPSEQLQDMIVEDVHNRIHEGGESILVITGGEPLLQMARLEELFKLGMSFDRVEFEANGTRFPDPWLKTEWNAFFNVSPKLTNSGIPQEERIKSSVLSRFSELDPAKVVFKFVCQDKNDLTEVMDLVGRHNIRLNQVWIMPEGKTREELEWHQKELGPVIAEMGLNQTTRLHVLTFGDRRGV